MPQLPEQSERKQFADQLRTTDRAVCVNSQQLANALTKQRNRKQSNRLALTVAIPVAATLVLIARFTLQVTTEIPPVVQIQPTSIEPAEFARTPTPTVSLTQQILLEAKQTELRNLEQEILAIRKSRAKQEWALAREVISRKEISRTVSAFTF